MELKKTKKFRVSSSEFFMTYSQCVYTLLELYNHIMFTMDDIGINYLLVSQERHEDGGIHFHCLLQLRSVYNLTSARKFDLGLSHPKIEKPVSSVAVRDYCMKDQVDTSTYMQYGVFTEISRPREKKQKITNKELLFGDLKTLIDDDKVSIYSLASITNARKIYNQLCIPEKPALTGDYFNSIWSNIELPILPKSIKKRHYWLYSKEPNKGKTSFLNFLYEHNRSYRYNLQEKYQTVSIGTEIICFDEYSKINSLLVTNLNELCDGKYQFPRKSLDAIQLDFPYIIVCSNYSIDQVYPSSSLFVHARFNEVSLDHSIFKN